MSLLWSLVLIVAFLALVFSVLGWLRLRATNASMNDPRLDQLLSGLDRLERMTREEQSESQRQLRVELAESSRALRVELAQSDAEFRAAISRDAAAGRTEQADALGKFASGFSDQINLMIQANERRMTDIRTSVEERLQTLQTDNATKLEEMRRTVDEKLHATLEQRLGESFKQVSERLEAVHKGLGEMQSLAAGVGDLKRVLTNVKSRGTWGEVQLARLIEDTMTPEQYAQNVKTVPGSDALVEFAIKLPGSGDLDHPVWLPIDAKFPKEEYERLMDAQDNADRDGVKNAGTALARAIEKQASHIVAKYVSPPYTTDFAIMFLPSEGLYAEVLRQPGLLDRLHAMRVNVAGPANLAALLNSLQMGFKTLAIQERSSEIWKVLRAVKTEFSKFGESLANVKKTLVTASNKIGETETRTRVMLKSLKDVEALPEEETVSILGQVQDEFDESNLPALGDKS